MTETPEWTVFFQSLQTQFTGQEKVYTIVCTNFAETFRTKSLTIQQHHVSDSENASETTPTTTYTASLEYHVLRCDGEATLTHDFPESHNSMLDVLEAFFRMLWTSTLCPECYTIIKASDSLCGSCYPMRVFYQYGVAHQHTLSVPTCSICFDQVYHSKLHCGHYVHKTCFIRMNTERWFSYDTELKCPICRTPINSQDRYDFFLWFG